jgi:drug/metabolite transporter (DMT)-like permease
MLLVTGRATLPSPQGLALMAGASLFGIAGYGALTQAMRTGQVSAVTPFRYTRIVFALAVGVLVFGERPDALTLAGSALIVACGLTLLLPVAGQLMGHPFDAAVARGPLTQKLEGQRA